MSRSESSSTQTSQSTTINQDQRIANESGTVIDTEGNFTINNSFGQDVQKAFDKVLDLSAGVLDSAGNIIRESIQANEKALDNSVTQSNNALDRLQLGNASLIKDTVPLIIIGVLGVVAINMFKKG